MPDTRVQRPVIFVPGITGTGLSDFYPVPPEEVWSAVLKKGYDRISMHPDDIRYEAMEPARVQAEGIFGIIYADFVEALRYDLSTRSTEPTPVYPFGYDWRQDCTRTADALAEFIQEVLDRTLLMPHYRRGSGSLRVDLVGHSMGGLVIADYLVRHGKHRKVGRVVSIGSPFEGAIDAVEKISTGMGTLTGEFPRDREREASRTIPALYQLLPSYEGAVEGVSELDLFKVDTWKTWQRSVLATLREYIRRHRAEITSEALLKQYLDAAWRHRRRLRGLDLSHVLPEGGKGWLAIAGVGSPTRTHVTAKAATGEQRWLDFPPAVDEWSRDRRSLNTGDGTVPFRGALPRFLTPANIVCVSPDEFGMVEFRDKLLARTAGFHAVLPTVNLIQRLAIKFLRRDYTGDVEGRPAPGVDTPDWPMPIPVIA